MSKAAALTALALLGMLVAGCERIRAMQAERDIASGCPDLPRLIASTAPADALRDIHTGNVKLLAVMGYAREIPGVPDQEAVRGKYRIAVIPGTTDAVPNRTCADLNDKARSYAQAFNEAVIALAHGALGHVAN